MDHIAVVSASFAHQHQALRGRSLQQQQEQNNGDSDASGFPENRNSGGGTNISSVIFFSAVVLFALIQLCKKLYSCFVGRSQRIGVVENDNSQQQQQQQPKPTKAERRRNLSETFEEQHIVKAISKNDFIPVAHIACGDEIDDIETERDSSQNHPQMVDADAKKTHEPAIVDLENGMGPDAIIKLPDWKACAPNCCAICLSEYKPGEVLVWSSNRSCMHVYHQECLLEYLVKVKDGSTPCPLCRQSFLIHEKNKEEETTEPNPQAIVDENEEEQARPEEHSETR